ncbi:PDZ domain (Also known as DHR or GLGF) [Stieleria bergensis]|uniref:PDZ domain (Also known as DHR or GLGF) n=1 Tax=Stieleria bergensis TaxID=2528025 RepID=A0A517SS80_9BACT|nr:PDZ domain (Also known as DHR or GLGF) [Planctomycetes bacterium SV_7m_r]
MKISTIQLRAANLPAANLPAMKAFITRLLITGWVCIAGLGGHCVLAQGFNFQVPDGSRRQPAAAPQDPRYAPRPNQARAENEPQDRSRGRLFRRLRDRVAPLVEEQLQRMQEGGDPNANHPDAVPRGDAAPRGDVPFAIPFNFGQGFFPSAAQDARASDPAGRGASSDPRSPNAGQTQPARSSLPSPALQPLAPLGTPRQDAGGMSLNPAATGARGTGARGTGAQQNAANRAAAEGLGSSILLAPNQPTYQDNSAGPNQSQMQQSPPSLALPAPQTESREILPAPRPSVGQRETAAAAGDLQPPVEPGGLGLQIAAVSGRRGVTVDRVSQPSVGAEMGFQAGDRIISVNGALVRSEQQFQSQVARTEGALTVKAVRSGRLVSLTASDQLRKNPPTESETASAKPARDGAAPAGDDNGMLNGLGSMFGRLIGGDAAAPKETKDTPPATKNLLDKLPLPAPAGKPKAVKPKAVKPKAVKPQSPLAPVKSETPQPKPLEKPPVTNPTSGESQPKNSAPKAETLSERIKRLKAELKAAETRRQQQEQQQQ